MTAETFSDTSDVNLSSRGKIRLVINRVPFGSVADHIDLTESERADMASLIDLNGFAQITKDGATFRIEEVR